MLFGTTDEDNNNDNDDDGDDHEDDYDGDEYLRDTNHTNKILTLIFHWHNIMLFIIKVIYYLLKSTQYQTWLIINSN